MTYRTTNHLKRIAFIDYIRGIAILSVFLYHAVISSYGRGILPWGRLFRSLNVPSSFIALIPLHLGSLGVAIFFVVSGFCIHLSFHQQGQEWRSFFIRRFFRLYPAYFAAMLLFLVLNTEKAHNLWFQFIRHVLLIHNYNDQTYFGINASFWTIAVEVQLYLLYPLLLWIVARYGWRTALVTVASCECGIRTWAAVYQTLQGVSGYDYPHLFDKLLPFYSYVDTPTLVLLNASPLAFWFSWSLGAYAADALLKNNPMSLAKSSIPFWIFLVVAAYFIRPLDPFMFLFCAVAITAVVSRHLSNTGPTISRSNFWLEQLRLTGVYSYSIYLLHQPLLGVWAKIPIKIFHGVDPFLNFLWCLVFWPVIMLLAALWYRVLEVPGVNLGKQIIQRIANSKNVSPASPMPAPKESDLSPPY